MKTILQSIFLSMWLTTLSFATTINVPADIDSIQGGINLAVDGDTVLVDVGTYYENINFNGKNIVVGSLTLTTGDTSYISQTIISARMCASKMSAQCRPMPAQLSAMVSRSRFLTKPAAERLFCSTNSMFSLPILCACTGIARSLSKS